MPQGPTPREMLARAHQPDDYITVDQLEAEAKFVRRLIGRLAA